MKEVRVVHAFKLKPISIHFFSFAKKKHHVYVPTFLHSVEDLSFYYGVSEEKKSFEMMMNYTIEKKPTRMLT